jgi:Fic family protein
LKPPYQLTTEILDLISSISKKIGAIEAVHLSKPETSLRKKNRIKTIQSSLEIEGNALSEKQVTAIMEGKRVLAPQKDIQEVTNAIEVYNQLNGLSPLKEKDFLSAHKSLMKNLLDNPGEYRVKNAGIIKGSQIEHIAPGGKMVKTLMKNLFHYLKNENENFFIKSCVFHYELEFIHPFTDGNGRMGRLWQTLILLQEHQIFEYLPLENIVKNHQAEYYKVLGLSDKAGHSTPFIEFMLKMIEISLSEIEALKGQQLKKEDRLNLFAEKIGGKNFSRKDYLKEFKEISAPTASRDLKWAVNSNILIKHGDKNKTEYQFK